MIKLWGGVLKVALNIINLDETQPTPFLSLSLELKL